MVKARKSTRSRKTPKPGRSRPTRKRAKKAVARKRGGSPTKAAAILKQLRRDQGATLAELMQATGWQAHSVRGFLSGTVRKRLGFPLRSESTDKGRRYWIERDSQSGSATS